MTFSSAFNATAHEVRYAAFLAHTSDGGDIDHWNDSVPEPEPWSMDWTWDHAFRLGINGNQASPGPAIRPECRQTFIDAMAAGYGYHVDDLSQALSGASEWAKRLDAEMETGEWEPAGNQQLSGGWD